MPYTYSWPLRGDGNILQLWNGVFKNPFTVAGAYPAHSKVGYTRTGTNAPKQQIATCPRPVYSVSFEWRYVSVPRGPRLAYKVYSKRLKKLVWARAPVLQKRLVSVKRKKKKPYKGLDLSPNALNFLSNATSYYGDNATVTVTDGSNTLIMQGSLWAPFNSYGSYSSWVNADNYVGAGISSHFDNYVAEADKFAIDKLYEKVKKQDVNLAQALAEYRQTASLFKEAISRLVKFWFRLRTGNMVSAARALLPGSAGGIANDWLLLQYGVKPLLSDIEGITKALTEREDFQFDIISRKRIEVPRTLIDVASGPRGITVAADEVYSWGYVEVKYKYRVLISSPKMSLERQMSRLGFGNLNTLAWESIPFSFVVDWFLPVGNYLNNADAFTGLQVLSSTKTVFRKEYIDFKRTFGGFTSGYSTSSQVCGFVNERVSCNRSMTALPTLHFPDFKDPISRGHIYNALALLSQLYKVK